MTEKHYINGSGMSGCLYDNGPHFTENLEDAIASLLCVFQDQLEEGEEERLRVNLTESGIHYFENPSEAGAQYCQVYEESGPCPENDD